MRLLLIVLVTGLLAASGFYYVQHSSGGSSADADARARDNAAVPVGVAEARRGYIRVYLDELGTVTPRSTVTVHSRVEGQLVRILFKEGQFVKQGDLLAELDASPYRAQLQQASGSLKRDSSLLKEAKTKYDRYKKLFGQDTIARQELDSQESLVGQYEGAVQADKGQMEAAEIQIRYAKIIAPIGGRIGLRQVDLGNIVHVGDQAGIATITELQPINVVFSIPEDNIPTVLRRMQHTRLVVEALDRAGGRKIAMGTLIAVDSQVDPATGTVKCKAEFANPRMEMFPNQFVNVRLFTEVLRDVIVVPSVAVQRGAAEPFVFLVKGDKAVLRKVRPGPVENNTTSIDAGIEPGDVVVIDGADSLHEGAKVRLPEKFHPSLPQDNTPGQGGEGASKILSHEKIPLGLTAGQLREMMMKNQDEEELEEEMTPAEDTLSAPAKDAKPAGRAQPDGAEQGGKP